MATNVSTPWIDLFSRLSKEDIDALHSAARQTSGDNSDFLNTVRTIAKDKGLKESSLGDSFERDALDWRRQVTGINEFQAPQEANQKPQKSGIDRFFENINRKDGSSGGSSETDALKAANSQLRSLQERELLQEFNHILETIKDPDQLRAAIDHLYDTHLSATGIIGREYDIIAQHAKGLGYKDLSSLEAEKQRRLADEEKLQGKKEDELTKAEREGLEKRKHHEADTKKRLLEIAKMSEKARRDALSRLYEEEWESYYSGLNGIKGHFKNIHFLDLGRGFQHTLARGWIQEYEEVERGEDVAVQQENVNYRQTQEPDMVLPQTSEQARYIQRALGLGRKVQNTAKALRSLGKAAQYAGKLAQAGGEAAKAEAAGGLTATGTGAVATSETWVPIVIIILLVIILGALLVVALIMIFGPNAQPPSAGITGGVLQNAQLISSYLCKTHAVDHGNCSDYSFNLYDNFRPYGGTDKGAQSLSISLPSFTGARKYLYFPNPNGTIRYYVRNDPDPNYPWGRFWCTDMVINSYAAAGFQDIVGWSDANYSFPNPDMRFWDTGNVSVMMAFFQTEGQKGYKYISRDNFNPDNIPPGSAIFFKWDNSNSVLGEHTAIVASVNQQQNFKKINVNAGTISIIQANGSSKTGSVWYSPIVRIGSVVIGGLEPDVVGFGVKTQ